MFVAHRCCDTLVDRARRARDAKVAGAAAAVLGVALLLSSWSWLSARSQHVLLQQDLTELKNQLTSHQQRRFEELSKRRNVREQEGLHGAGSQHAAFACGPRQGLLLSSACEGVSVCYLHHASCDPSLPDCLLRQAETQHHNLNRELQHAIHSLHRLDKELVGERHEVGSMHTGTCLLTACNMSWCWHTLSP